MPTGTIIALIYFALGVITVCVLLSVRRKEGIKDAFGFLHELVMDFSSLGLLCLAMFFWPIFVTVAIVHHQKKKEPIQPPETTRGK